jgi:hypothetical protein
MIDVADLDLATLGPFTIVSAMPRSPHAVFDSTPCMVRIDARDGEGGLIVNGDAGIPMQFGDFTEAMREVRYRMQRAAFR